MAGTTAYQILTDDQAHLIVHFPLKTEKQKCSFHGHSHRLTDNLNNDQAQTWTKY